MLRIRLTRIGFIAIFSLTTLGVLGGSHVCAQGGKKQAGAKVCGNPTVKCKTTANFDANDLPFRVPAKATIWESEQFYAVILKSVSSPDDNCDVFISEADRLEAQGLYPNMKVFSSRCTMGGSLYYSNVASNQQFMAVFAGLTKAQADRMLATVKESGKYPGANVRRMRVGFNGT